MIFKIVPRDLWAKAERDRRFDGAPVDLQDGFIHFSTASQLAETAAKHFAGQTDLVLVAVDEQRLGQWLKWEVSRNDELFPHLYACLALEMVEWVKPLPWTGTAHAIPDGVV